MLSYNRFGPSKLPYLLYIPFFREEKFMKWPSENVNQALLYCAYKKCISNTERTHFSIFTIVSYTKCQYFNLLSIIIQIKTFRFGDMDVNVQARKRLYV